MSEKPYTPSPEELQKAEKMMSEEERTKSSYREEEYAKKHAEEFTKSTEEARRKELVPYRIIERLFKSRESSKHNLTTPEEAESLYYDKEKGASLIYFQEDAKRRLEIFPMSEEELMADNPWGFEDEEGKLLPLIDCIEAYPGGFRMGETGEPPTYFDLKEKLSPKLIRYETPHLDKDKARKETLPTAWVIMVKKGLFRGESLYAQLASLSHVPEPEVRKMYAKLLGFPETSDAETLAQAFLNRFRNEKERLSQGDSRIQEELFKNSDYEVASMLAELFRLDFHEKKTGERLDPETYARTRDLVSDGLRVYVGTFRPGGLDVRDWHDDDADPLVGLSVARKVPQVTLIS